MAVIRARMFDNFLKLNDDKTELIVFDSMHYIISTPRLEVQISSDAIQAMATVRNLGVFCDGCLPMETHVNSMYLSFYHNIRIQ